MKTIEDKLAYIIANEVGENMPEATDVNFPSKAKWDLNVKAFSWCRIVVKEGALIWLF